MILTLCMMGNFACFCRLLIFTKLMFSNYSLRMSNSMDRDQARCFVSKLFADDTSRHRQMMLMHYLAEEMQHVVIVWVDLGCKRQSQLQQTTNFAIFFLIFD